MGADRVARAQALVVGRVIELLQQVLVEPEPTRTVNATPAACWYGIDPSTKRVSLAAVRAGGERSVSTRSFPSADGPRRLALIYAETFAFVTEWAARAWPGFVLVEQPSGKSPNPNLVYAVGVVQAATYAALHNARGTRPCPVVETVPSATWKRLAIGPGWAKLSKPDGDVLRFAQEDGYGGVSLDEADAWLIAKAARRTVRLG